MAYTVVPPIHAIGVPRRLTTERNRYDNEYEADGRRPEL